MAETSGPDGPSAANEQGWAKRELDRVEAETKAVAPLMPSSHAANRQEILDDFYFMRKYLGDEHACLTEEEGWRPCPFGLCERPDHKHDICPECRNDLATFMHEQTCSRSWPDA